jgi:hypothetical protein
VIRLVAQRVKQFQWNADGKGKDRVS